MYRITGDLVWASSFAAQLWLLICNAFVNLTVLLPIFRVLTAKFTSVMYMNNYSCAVKLQHYCNGSLSVLLFSLQYYWQPKWYCNTAKSDAVNLTALFTVHVIHTVNADYMCFFARVLFCLFCHVSLTLSHFFFSISLRLWHLLFSSKAFIKSCCHT